MKRKNNLFFLTIISILLFLPMILTRNGGMVSGEENRTLAKRPSLFREDGKPNFLFPLQFEDWVNDNVGGRDICVKANAWIQYHIFGNLSSDGMYLGPNGELNYATDPMLRDYQHLNLLTDNQLQEICRDYQRISDWMESQGISFYYMQCFDKHSIYPEQFMENVNQYGSFSRTDQIINSMKMYTTIPVIDTKNVLLEEKENEFVYSVWGDVTHWNQHGAYIGYLEAMRIINAHEEENYRILCNENFVVTVVDQGNNLNGIIHKTDMQKSYVIANPQSSCVDKASYLGEYAKDERHHVFQNIAADNRTRLLIVGDSYIEQFLLQNFAENFYEVIFVQADYTKKMADIIEITKPDIVIYECAERCDRTGVVQWLAESLYEP